MKDAIRQYQLDCLSDAHRNILHKFPGFFGMSTEQLTKEELSMCCDILFDELTRAINISKIMEKKSL